MKRVISTSLVVMTIVFASDFAQAGVQYFTDESAWLAFVGSSEPFGTSAAEVALANEVPSLPSGDTDLGSSTLTFTEANTGLSWGFQLRTDQPGASWVFSDNPINPNFADKLSVGNVNAYENDDWTLEVTSGPSLYACAFDLVEDEQIDGELIRVYGVNEELLGSFQPHGPGLAMKFVGLVSTTPIGKIVFNEDAIDDDICLTNFQFAVPEPATLSLLLIGTLALFRRRSRAF